MARKIRGVLFDVDDTLVNSRPAMEEALGIIARRLSGFAESMGMVAQHGVTEKLFEIDKRMHAGFRYNRDEWWRTAAAELWPGLQLPGPLLKSLTEEYWGIVRERSLLYPDALPTIARLRREGYRLGAVTDTDGTRGVKLERMASLGLTGHFDAIVVGGEDTEGVKPDPEPFLLAASRLGIPPEECVMVGDRPYTDIRGAKAAGMRAVWLKRREWEALEACDAAVNSLVELPAILVRI